MKKYLVVLVLLTALIVTGCTATDPGYEVIVNTPLPVTGNITSTGTISGNVSVTNTPLPVTGNVTVTNTPLPISGNVTVSNLPVSGNNTRLDVTIVDEYGFEAENTPFNELRIAQCVKLAGTVFIGNTLDTNFVAQTVLNGGTVTQTGGQMLVQTNTTANGYAQAYTQRRGRFVAGASNMAKLVIQLGDAGGANNVRRWGIGDLDATQNVTDGAFYSINGTTFAVNTLRGSTLTTVNSGSFNGHVTSYTLDTNEHVYEIYYSPYRVYFTIDGALIHTVNATAAPWTNTVTLYAGMDNRNSGGSTTNHILYCRAFSISRLGPLVTAPIYKHISTATTTICKFGAGTLHKIVMNNPTNNSITIYDNTSAGGTIIAVINPGSSATPQTLDYELDFYTGLTIVTAGTPDLTIVYE